MRVSSTMFSRKSSVAMPKGRALRHKTFVVANMEAAMSNSTRSQFPIKLKTGENSRLSIGLFGFSYNATGGEVRGVATLNNPQDPNLSVRFEKMEIPPLDSRTGAISMPVTNQSIVQIPPVFTVTIQPLELTGTLDSSTGKMFLEFVSDFYFTFSLPFLMNGDALYRAPPIHIRTLLTTESIQPSGIFQYTRLNGTRWSAEDGLVHLVGRAEVVKTGDWALDQILTLPSTCFAELSGQLSIGSSAEYPSYNDLN